MLLDELFMLPKAVKAGKEKLQEKLDKMDERAVVVAHRKGMFYKRMKTNKFVCHASELLRLPVGSVVIKRFYKYAYEFRYRMTVTRNTSGV